MTSRNRHLIKTLWLGIILICPVLIFAQYSNQEIDSLYEKTKSLRKEGNYNKVDSVYRLLLKNAKKNNYAKGIVNLYIKWANLNILKANYTLTNRYLDSAELYVPKVNDPLIQTTFYAERGRSFYYLDLLDLSLKNFETALSISPAIKVDSVRERIDAYIYEYQSLTFEKNNQLDSALIKTRMALTTVPGPERACRMAGLFLRDFNNIDSARRYLNAAGKLLETGKFNVYARSVVLRMEGLFHFVQGNFKKAVDFYSQSAEICRMMKVKKDEMISNRLLYAAFKALNDREGMANALEQYTLLAEDLSVEEKKAIEIVVSGMLAQKDKNAEKVATSFYIWIVLLVFAAITIIYFIIHKYRRKVERKNHQLTQQGYQIEETIKKQEALSQMVNESFEEIVELAKTNSPIFFARFWEVYPRLKARLFAINPTLRASELTLCAYIYLNFSTKEIAEYTFKSARTIQSQKSDLRKRLQIPSTQDLYSWIQLGTG